MIPAKVHFVWMGESIPWAYAFAIMSAARRAELDEVILHHTDVLRDLPAIRALSSTPGVTLRHVDAPAWLASLTRVGLDGGALADLYRTVTNPVARSNILRAAAVVDFGGIYLDLDTITVRSLRPLLEARDFIGVEHIVWPHVVRSSKNPVIWAHALALAFARGVLRFAPRGYQLYPKIASAYYLGINGAILGGEQRSAFSRAYLDAMIKVPPERRLKKHALGTFLLQQEVDRYRGTDLTIHPPEVFYPLSPEISEHWFRISRSVRLDRALAPETRVAHWYASVHTKRVLPKIDPAYVKRLRTRQLYSAMVTEALPELA